MAGKYESASKQEHLQLIIHFSLQPMARLSTLHSGLVCYEQKAQEAP